MLHRVLSVGVVFVVALFGAPLMSVPASADGNPTIVVTTTADVVDAGDGVLSLREAVSKANTDAGADTIQLATDETYELTICGEVEDITRDTDNGRRNLNSTDPDGLALHGEASIVRQTCSDATLFQTGSSTVGDSALEVDGVTFDGGSGWASVFVRGDMRFHDSAITGFEGPSTPTSPYLSALMVDGSLEATDSRVSDNRNVAGVYGGLHLQLVDSVVDGNGGAVALKAGGAWADGPIEIVRSRIADNTAADVSLPPWDWGDGVGGVSGYGAITITDSEIVGNTGFVGGVGRGGGPIAVTGSRIHGNHGAVGGGVSGYGLDIRGSVIDGNDAGFGGGIAGSGSIADSTIAGNHAVALAWYGSDGSGGGVLVEGEVQILRTTISGNSGVTGSALLVTSSNPNQAMRVAASTISGNPLTGPADPEAPTPAEVWLDVSGANDELRFLHSAVGTPGIPTCGGDATAVVAEGGNFFTDHSCPTSVTGSDILDGGDPELGALGDNGGATPTMVPMPGSPLRDRVSVADERCSGVDQRGIPRPQGLGCDIGAVEAEVDPAGFVGVSPTRILDTRSAPVPDAWVPGAKLSGGWMTLKVAGVNGVPADASAVVLNVTSTEAASAQSYVTLWPAGDLPPATSNLNLQPGGNVANSVTVAPGVGGAVWVGTNLGSTHLIVDVLGYYAPKGGDDFTSVTPLRMVDTRYGPVPPGRTVGQKLAGPGTLHLPVAGVSGVPADVTSVVVNITSTQASSDLAYVTAWPSGQDRPTASNLNLQPAYNVSNLAFVKVGEDGAIDLYTNAGSTHLVVDVVGWFRPSVGDRFLPLNPARVFSSLPGSPLSEGVPVFATVAGVEGVPTDATAVVFNATSAQASSAGGYLQVFAKGAPLANATGSNLNYRPPYNAPNQVIAQVGDDHSVTLLNGYGTVHILIDANGYFVGD